MQIAIIQFPGSNCERETIAAVQRVGMEAVEFLWNESCEKLTACDGFIIVGGFSYEDRSRSGVIAALDPIMSVIKTQVALGKPLLGICNGAQIIVESGLLGTGLALTQNKRVQGGVILGTSYYNAWVYLKLANQSRPNAFNRHLGPEQILKVPVAHAEGRFIMSPDVLADLNAHGQIAFQYCNEQGAFSEEFPVNPNGSMQNIAAITNRAGNVMAMMPHPERTTIGDPLFLAMRDYIQAGIKPIETMLTPKQQFELFPYQKSPSAYECIVELIIADNHAISVETALRNLGIDVKVTRKVHWEIVCDSRSLLHQIQASGLLYNDRKEFQLDAITKSVNQKNFLVRAKEDLIGQQKRQQLTYYFGMGNIDAIQHAVLWQIETESDLLEQVAKQVLETNILFNSTSHECFQYE